MKARVVVDGKHLMLDAQPFRVRGVTFGSFVPRLDGELFPERSQVKADFAMIADAGMNCVRTYSVPPIDVIEAAEEHDLRLLVGMDYHDWRMEPEPSRAARARIRDDARRTLDLALERCSGRTSILAVAVGNEVPADVVRVHGIAAVQDAFSELVGAIHDSDDHLLATYVNFPTTEFLQVDQQDLVCFNVFLEDPATLLRYLRHLQVVAGPRPLLVSELGLAAEIHGEEAQSASLRKQLAVVDDAGCAGATVFSWTDEWGVAGQAVEGWGFGVTDKERHPKLALSALTEWAHTPLVGRRDYWPQVSVVVCAYNEERTIEECLSSLERCTYPDLEVLVCDDGSTDRTLEIARGFPFRLLELQHGGLSHARNAGLAASSGDVIAYLDADAACHPEWPFHLVLSLDGARVAATGGPNLPVVGAGFVERAVAQSPGAPAEVLVADDRAEHVPGCNMAYVRRTLEEIGGFDPVYTSAGDDVDVCWKLLERGDEIAFAPAAQVHHHRRGTVRGYLRQQRGYGRAERMLAGAHPQRFNRLAQARWRGFIYGGAAILPSLLRPVVYHGYMGAAPFQPVARRRAEIANMWAAALLPLTLPVAALGLLLAFLSPWWALLSAAAALVVAAYLAAVAASIPSQRGEPKPRRLALLVGFLHLAQPFARTWGRLRGRPAEGLPFVHPAWSGDRWTWLRHLERELRTHNCSTRPGSPSAPWDLEVRAGPLLVGRVTTAVMWHWEPHYSVAYRLRPLAWIAAALVVGVALADPSIGWFLLAGTGVLLAIEAAILRTRVRAALAHTTAGAGR
jgi:glycosyltransferase involved in cell wall biosynthesis